MGGLKSFYLIMFSGLVYGQLRPLAFPYHNLRRPFKIDAPLVSIERYGTEFTVHRLSP